MGRIPFVLNVFKKNAETGRTLMSDYMAKRAKRQREEKPLCFSISVHFFINFNIRPNFNIP